ncbi:GSK-3-binding protein-like [Lethenteron reissneri]|uniref:GSK-3-binding protein-like n=1 Tax=Lethenteron reissneri TaxID=7753 RepID=UPI002AB62C34|nr:GSK-3-binding protein-like [Lethenteron reissneri]
MPCRESYEPFKAPATGDRAPSQEMDELVRRLGETLRLKAVRPGRRSLGRRSSPYCVPSKAAAGSGAAGATGRGAARGATGGAGARRRKGGRGGENGGGGEDDDEEEEVVLDDPREMLRELLLSGNLIKEAVRRLRTAPCCCPDS